MLLHLIANLHFQYLSEHLIRRTARRMVEDGYLDAGYEYIIVDDCWSEYSRDNETSRLVADLKRFPRGMKDLADYVSLVFLKYDLYNFNIYIYSICSGSFSWAEIRNLPGLRNKNMWRISGNYWLRGNRRANVC